MRTLLSLTLAAVAVCWLSQVEAQTSHFTYQGVLKNSGSPAHGNFEMRFTPYADSATGLPLSDGILRPVSTTDGIVTLDLDFGSTLWTGARVWLEVAVRTNEPAEFSVLTPRQEITSTPYAVRASKADSAGIVTGPITEQQLPGNVALLNVPLTFTSPVQFANASGTFQGAFTGNGGGITNLSGSAIAPGTIGPLQLGTSGGFTRIYTNSGEFKTPEGVQIIWVTMLGGGGGGGAGDQIIGGDNYGGGGGGSGGFITDYPIFTKAGSVYSVIIGTGGSGAPAGQTGGSPYWSGYPGSSGGTTTFGNLLEATGGLGGAGALGINEGGGGEGGVGGEFHGIHLASNLGLSGRTGSSRADNNTYIGGKGADSIFGGGGAAAAGANGNGAAADGFGAGGGGGAPSDDNNGKGGDGSPGVVIVRY